MSTLSELAHYQHCCWLSRPLPKNNKIDSRNPIQESQFLQHTLMIRDGVFGATLRHSERSPLLSALLAVYILSFQVLLDLVRENGTEGFAMLFDQSIRSRGR